jgi:hypothetical protein
MADTKVAKPKVERYRVEAGTVEGFISDAFGIITGLGEEFREIYDNATEGLQQTQTNQTRDETASACENLSEPTVNNTIIGEIECSASLDMGKTYRGRQTQSRACQAGNAAAMFNAAADAVRQWVEDNPVLDEDATKKEKKEHEEKLEANGWDADTFSEAHEEADTVISECEDCASEIESMEWPGMFG